MILKTKISKFFFLKCLNQYSNFPEMKSYDQNLVCIRKEQGLMLVNKLLGYKNNSNLANNEEIDEGYRQ